MTITLFQLYEGGAQVGAWRTESLQEAQIARQVRTLGFQENEGQEKTLVGACSF